MKSYNLFSILFFYLFYLLINFTVSSEVNNMDLATASTTDCKCGRVFDGEDIAPRVVGGGQMGPNSHPFLALILYWDIFVCGGSIISPTFILTAGHCVTSHQGYGPYTVAVGVHNRVRWSEMNGRIHPVLEVIKHNQFKDIDHLVVNDIALLRVDPLQFNNFVQPICLPIKINVNRYKAARIAGWGSVRDEAHIPSMIPRQALISMLTFEQYRYTVMYHILKEADIPGIHDRIVYGYKRNTDPCNGDSGGPLYVLGQDSMVYLIGIVSMGLDCGNSEGIPGIYTSVHYYLDWIQQHTNHTTCSPAT